MTYDPLEWTVRDPLEDTVPDPVERRRRLSGGRRRAIEAVALAVVGTGYLTAQWIDDSHQARAYPPARERVTVVGRGGSGTIGHVRLRLLGRDTTGQTTGSTVPAGATLIKLVLTARPLDAQGVKSVQAIGFTVRDRAGHVWSAFGASDRDVKPAVGTDMQVTVTASVPARLAGSVVLEARPGRSLRLAEGPTPVLRFAH
jgi:hypothetical protein